MVNERIDKHEAEIQLGNDGKKLKTTKWGRNTIEPIQFCGRRGPGVTGTQPPVQFGGQIAPGVQMVLGLFPSGN